ncbi:ankyrin [Rhizodiscina lignyota]|uniref:Ankyrin n=1 Tax=Rhizodiscina lignyota TaxID=1504668 RepID=A0A9P4I678_9PEZI|nr:ankyrin [Rhizodiscina lignyota]
MKSTLWGGYVRLPSEMAAARAMLDRIHKPLPARRNDNNTYVLGRIGDHSVVVACLPSHSTGTVSAATVAQQMLATFEPIRFGLMVGIGGGIPSIGIPNVKEKEIHDIRLGDVVVSDPGTLDKPPSVLRTAVAKLRADHDMEKDRLPKYLEEMVSKFPNMQTKYGHQGVENDRLFRFDYDHIDSSDDSCARCDPSGEVKRPPRADARPVIFYGLIASGDNLMRHGGSREKLRKELDALCVEMEAAGLLDEFPCLAIRGICDYADTHKNDRWQPYAAATAAAYAKELLLSIPKAQVTGTKKATEVTDMKLFHLSSLASEVEGIDLNSRDDNGRTPLHIASQLQDEKLVKEYVQRMTSDKLGQQDVGQFTPVHLSNGHEGVLRALLPRMRPKDFGVVNCYAFTVLDEAVMNWPPLMTELLLEYMLPQDIDQQNISGWTAMHQACEHGREGAVRPLLKRMSPRAVWSRTSQPARRTALHMATLTGSLSIVEALVNAGNESQIATTDEKRRTALHIASEEGSVDIVECLLEKMDVDDVWNSDVSGNTALHNAAANSHREVVKLLLSKVTDLDDLTRENNMGQSAYDVAQARKDKRISKLIAATRENAE